MDELKGERIARSRTYPASDERLKSSIHAEHVRFNINFRDSNESFSLLTLSLSRSIMRSTQHFHSWTTQWIESILQRRESIPMEYLNRCGASRFPFAHETSSPRQAEFCFKPMAKTCFTFPCVTRKVLISATHRITCFVTVSAASGPTRSLASPFSLRNAYFQKAISTVLLIRMPYARNTPSVFLFLFFFFTGISPLVYTRCIFRLNFIDTFCKEQ